MNGTVGQHSQINQLIGTNYKIGIFFYVSEVLYQQCFIFRPLDSTVSKDARIEPDIVATFAHGSQKI